MNGGGTAHAGVAFVLLALSPGCSAHGCEEAQPAERARLTVELAGCAAVTRGPTCEVSPMSHEVRLFVRAEDAEGLHARFRERDLPIAWADASGGKRATIDVPVPDDAAKHPLVVASSSGAPRAYELAIVRAVSDPRLDEVATLRNHGHLEEAGEKMPDPASMPEALRGRAASLKARLDLSSARVDEAVAGLRGAMETHGREGRVSDQVLDGMALVYVLLTNGRRYAEARAVVAGLAEPLSFWDEGRARMPYYEALLAQDSGDARAALRLLAETEAATTRLGLDSETHNARQVRASLLQSLGRHEEALVTLKQLEADLGSEKNPCRKADLWNDIGWAGMWQAEQGARPQAADSPETRALGERLEETLALYRDTCPQPMDIQNAHVNLAFFALQHGDLPRAAREIAEARKMAQTPTSLIASWLLDLEGRLALAQGDAKDALARYDELGLRARAAYAPEAIWRAELGRGLAHSALGDKKAAIEAFSAAEARLDEEGRRVPLGEGRAAFLSDRDRSARYLTDTLVAEGRVREAMDAARRARVRALASARRLDRLEGLSAASRAKWDDAMGRYRAAREALDEQAAEDWKLAADKLAPLLEARKEAQAKAQATLDEALNLLSESGDRAALRAEPREGELWIAVHPTGEGDVRVFAREASGIAERVTPWPPPGEGAEAQAAVLIEPFAERVAAARTIRVFPYGALSAVDFHALPFRGAPLIDHAAVVYAADLPELPPRPSEARAKALVVGDTQSDLPHALREANAVSAQIARDFEVTRLEGERATRPEVLASLATSALLHFAGHGVFVEAQGMDSSLTLAGASRLSVSDILGLTQAPARVVLSGCETGRAGPARVADLSLASAFLAAGSEVVVAAARPVDDRLGEAFAEALYATAKPADWDVAASFQRASRAARAAWPQADWSSYRVMTR